MKSTRSSSRTYASLVFTLLLAISRHRIECFSTASYNRDIDRIKSIITSNNVDGNTNTNDGTTIPIETIASSLGITPDAITYTTDFDQNVKMSTEAYTKYTAARHLDCINLFDGYNTTVTRCETLDRNTLNVRWKASFIPAGSTWLYNLADLAGWTVTTKSPDPVRISTFSWKSVLRLFQHAFKTGNITLPISLVEGNTVVSIKDESSADKKSNTTISISLKENIDLVSEADKSRLQNRRVAQECAAWIDVSRRPPNADPDEFARIVRERILLGVPGAGVLDVDPNEDDAEGVIVLIFSTFCVAVLGISFEYIFHLP